jgi:hypothetical protein
VVLAENPNDVKEWMKRIAILQAQDEDSGIIAQTYSKAI